MQLFYLLLSSLIVLAILHMVAPDHWVPISFISSARNFSYARRTALSFILGIVHATTSTGVAALAMVIGILITRSYLTYLYDGGEMLLILVGLYFIISGFMERRNSKNIESFSTNSALAVSVFPDLALVPIMVYSISLGLFEISILFTIFILVSAVSLSVIVFVASTGIGNAIREIKPRHVDYLMGLILILTAGFVRLL